jgi:hypothetical protein
MYFDVGDEVQVLGEWYIVLSEIYTGAFEAMCSEGIEYVWDVEDVEDIRFLEGSVEDAGFDYAIAIATQAEVEAGAACGQLSIIVEENEEK